MQTKDSIVLYAHPLSIRLFKPPQQQGEHPLLIYATGDGGWWELGSEIFNWLTQWGYPVAGFSSREYLKNLGYLSDTTTPERLARDYEQIIRYAENRMGLPERTPVILVGLSRGAGLSVVAAGQGSLSSELAGVLAIALTKEEEHVLHYRMRPAPGPGKAREPERVVIETYRYLDRLVSLPVMVLQSTHDHYLPAQAARVLFGPDTRLRKLLAIDAKNHSFRDGCPELHREAESGLQWMTGLLRARLHGS